MRLVTLKKRQEFVSAARDRNSRKWAMPTVLVQSMPDPMPDPKAAACASAEDGEPVVRIGFTATKRLGGAVVRNRVRRRLRAAVSEVLPHHAKPGYAYVFVGRATTATCPYQCLLDDLKTALIKLHSRHRSGASTGTGRQPRRNRHKHNRKPDDTKTKGSAAAATARRSKSEDL